MELKFLVLPFVALVFTQLIKIFIFSRKKKFSWKDFDSYGGMPSSHSAFMFTALTEAWQQFGLESATFAIITFITFIVLRDAVGLRQTIGHHASTINTLVTDLPDELEDKYNHLEPRQGHTYPQIAVGMLIGIAIALIF